MDKKQFCTHINLPDVILDQDVLNLHNYIPFNIPEKYINPEVSSILRNKGFDIESIEIFKANKANPRLKIHIDDSPFLNGGYVHDDIGKLNWIYGNLNCNMIWYRELEGTVRKDSVNSFSPFVEFAEEDVEEIININLGRNAIIQAAIPHTVINETEIDWYCVGIHVKYQGLSRVPYSFLIDKLKEYVLPV